jgi:hypothetical protein
VLWHITRTTKFTIAVDVVFARAAARNYLLKNPDGNQAVTRKNPHVIDVGSGLDMRLN